MSGVGKFVARFVGGSPWCDVRFNDKHTRGAYIGIDVSAASSGASFTNSLVEYTIDHDGLTMSQQVQHQGKIHKFRTHFSREWIFRLMGWDVDGCISVRQHKNSDLAQIILAFSPSFCLNPVDMYVLLGEGMFAVLNVFVRKNKRYSPLRWLLLKIIYFSAKRDGKVNASKEAHSWLIPIEVSDANMIMDSNNPTKKISFLDDVGHNLWTATSEELEKRLPIIEMGIMDRDPNVQRAALSTFVLGGRVTAGVQLVAKTLKQHQELDMHVTEEAVQAATVLLYETYKFLKRDIGLRSAFNTSDITLVHEKSNGAITPEQAEELEDVVRHYPQHRIWTYEHYQKLRAVLSEFISSGGCAKQQTNENALRALREYAL